MKDFKFFISETVFEPDEKTGEWNDVSQITDFDFLCEDGFLKGCKTLTSDKEALTQKSIFAIREQSGCNPFDLSAGSPWAEYQLNEVSAPSLIASIMDNLKSAKTGAVCRMSITKNEKVAFVLNV